MVCKQTIQNNEKPAMRNLIIDGAAGGETKRRHDVTFAFDA
jgi:hypothetical protein